MGYIGPNKAKIVEATDGGLENAVHMENEFQYDARYVQHVSNLLSRLYDPPLALIGVWHSHMHSLEPIFSSSDEELHARLTENEKQACVSILFQKVESKKEEFRMRAFSVERNTECREVTIKVR